MAKNKSAIWGRECSLPNLQRINRRCRINTSSPSSDIIVLICKTWRLGENPVQFLTIGQIQSLHGGCIEMEL